MTALGVSGGAGRTLLWRRALEFHAFPSSRSSITQWLLCCGYLANLHILGDLIRTARCISIPASSMRGEENRNLSCRTRSDASVQCANMVTVMGESVKQGCEVSKE